MAENLKLAVSKIAEIVPELAEAKAMIVINQATQAGYMLEQSVQKHPTHCDSWHALGHSYRMQNRQDEAMNAYTRAIEIAYRYHAPIHFECSAQFLIRALLHFPMGEEQKAKDDLESAIFQDHDNRAALQMKRDGWKREMQLPIYDRNLMTECEWYAEVTRKRRELQDMPPHQQTHDKAVFFMRQGDWHQAGAILSDLVKQRPAYPIAWHHRALVFLELGESRQAFADINRAITEAMKWHEEYHRDAALHHYHRGQLYAEKGEMEMAVMDFSKALDLDKHFAEVYAARAWVRGALEQYPTAIADMEQALSLEPEHPEWITKRDQWWRIVRG
jgi:Tfp pilus assembly protein PilF